MDKTLRNQTMVPTLWVKARAILDTIKRIQGVEVKSVKSNATKKKLTLMISRKLISKVNWLSKAKFN